jgi:hypothetical protein
VRTLVPAPTQEEAQVVYSPILYPSSLYRPASSLLCPPREEELYDTGGGFKIERERLRLGSFCAMNYRIRFIASLRLLAQECSLFSSALVIASKPSFMKPKTGEVRF